MTPLRLAAAELRRLTATGMGRLALAAIVLIPSLYGGLYLYANKDPYGGLSRVPAAVVVLDEGTTLATGEHLQVGPQVAESLIESKSFDWHQVDRADAEDGVRSGTYDFALVVPATFSADLASSAQWQPRQAQLDLITNDANNYMAYTIANQVVAQVTKSVATEVTSTAANQLLVGFSTIHDKVAQAADGAGTLSDGLASAASGADQLHSGADQLVAGNQKLVDGATSLAVGARDAKAGAAALASGAGTLAGGLATMDQQTSSLPGQTTALADGAGQVAAGNAVLAQKAAAVAGAASSAHDALTTGRSQLDADLANAGLTPAQIATVDARLDQLAQPLAAANTQVQDANSQIQALSAGAQQVATGAQTLAAAAGPLHDGIHQAATGAQSVRTGAGSLSSGLTTLSAGADTLADGERTALGGAQQLADGASTLRSGLHSLADGAASLKDGLTQGLSSIPNPSAQQRTAVAQTLGNPVSVNHDSQATAGLYGSGLAPFFMSLALWIGAYVLFLLVRPLSARALAANVGSLRVALGGWLAPAALGVVQAGVLFAVLTRLVDLPVSNPVGAIAFMVLVTGTYAAILHVLAARLGAVGKFLGLVLMVVQLVSSGGTFPWQTLPEPLHPIHQVLPMGYAVDGLRALMYGADASRVWVSVAVMGAYLVGALALSAATARSRRRWNLALVKPAIDL